MSSQTGRLIDATLLLYGRAKISKVRVKDQPPMIRFTVKEFTDGLPLPLGADITEQVRTYEVPEDKGFRFGDAVAYFLSLKKPASYSVVQDADDRNNRCWTVYYCLPYHP